MEHTIIEENFYVICGCTKEKADKVIETIRKTGLQAYTKESNLRKRITYAVYLPNAREEHGVITQSNLCVPGWHCLLLTDLRKMLRNC